MRPIARVLTKSHDTANIPILSKRTVEILIVKFSKISWS